MMGLFCFFVSYQQSTRCYSSSDQSSPLVAHRNLQPNNNKLVVYTWRTFREWGQTYHDAFADLGTGRHGERLDDRVLGVRAAHHHAARFDALQIRRLQVLEHDHHSILWSVQGGRERVFKKKRKERKEKRARRTQIKSRKIQTR
jgi:hypothetical protein